MDVGSIGSNAPLVLNVRLQGSQQDQQEKVTQKLLDSIKETAPIQPAKLRPGKLSIYA